MRSLREALRRSKACSMRAVLVLFLIAAATPAAIAEPKAEEKAAEKKAKKPDGKAKADDKKADAKKPDAKADAKKPDAKPEPPPRTPGPDDAKATAVLGKIVAGPDAAARKAAIAELGAIAPTAIDAL